MVERLGFGVMCFGTSGSLGGTWPTLDPALQAQSEEAQQAVQQFMEQNQRWLKPDNVKRIQLERQRQQAERLAQSARLETAMEILRQLILWPMSALFAWVGGWFGLLGLLSFPLDQLMIRRDHEADGDVLVLARRSLPGTSVQKHALISFDQLSWDVQTRSVRYGYATIWTALVLSRMATVKDLEFALLYQGGLSDNYEKPPEAVQSFLRAMQKLTGLSIQNPQIESTSNFLGRKITKSLRRTLDLKSMDELPPELSRQIQQMLSDPTKETVCREEKYYIEIKDADGKVHTFSSLDELPEDLRRQVERLRKSF